MIEHAFKSYLLEAFVFNLAYELVFIILNIDTVIIL